jgi:hypothetical protein
MPESFFAALRFTFLPDDPNRPYAETSSIKKALDLATIDRKQRFAAGQAARKANKSEEADRINADASLLRNYVEKPLQNLHRKLGSGNWRIAASSRDLVEDDQTLTARPRLRLNVAATSDAKQFVLTSVLNWRALLGFAAPRWKSVTIMAANFSQTFAALTLEKQGFELVPHPIIVPNLRYRDAHPNGDRFTILYASSKPMSKRKRDTLIDNKTFGQHIFEAVEATFRGKRFAWSANNDVPDLTLTGTRMPYVAHGLNEFIQFADIAVLNITNLNPQSANAIEEHGFSREQVRAALMAENVYQGCFRGIGRDPESVEAVTLIVPDAVCAQFIADRAPGCHVAPLGISEAPHKAGGRPRVHQDDAARERSKKANQRLDEKARKQASLERYRKKVIANVVGSPVYSLKLYNDVHAAFPNLEGECIDYDDLLMTMRNWFDGPATDEKSDNALILQAVLQASDELNEHGKPKQRGLPNIASRSTLWLDIESQEDGASGPPIPPDEIKRIFGGFRLTLYTSFKHEESDPAKARYRVVMPLSHAVGGLCPGAWCKRADPRRGSRLIRRPQQAA